VKNRRSDGGDEFGYEEGVAVREDGGLSLGSVETARSWRAILVGRLQARAKPPGPQAI